jgi:hypothetical protein
MDLITILAALLPVLIEGGKAAVSRWIAPAEFKPATIDQAVALRRLDLEFFQALSGAGGANPSYPWVEGVVKLMRPAVAAAVLATWCYIHLTVAAEADTATVDNFAAAIGFYMFGDRTLFYAKRGPGK